MDFKNLLVRIDSIVAEEKAGSMKSAEHHRTGPKFTGKWKGTDDASKAKTKYVGGESILKDFEQQLKENPRTEIKRDLMREYREFVTEYGGVGGYGAASQAPQPQGTGNADGTPDLAKAQQALDAQQIKKSTNLVAPTLDSQGAAQPTNKLKFSDVMSKLDQTPNTELGGQELKQLAPLAVATSKALQDPSTANQLKQLITKADKNDQTKQQQVNQAQQQIGTNNPQTPGTVPAPGTPGTTPSAGQSR